VTGLCVLAGVQPSTLLADPCILPPAMPLAEDSWIPSALKQGLPKPCSNVCTSLSCFASYGCRHKLEG
jgi:hypothetical protein